MGMKQDTCEISGVWSGRYDRDQDDSEGVRFSAWLNISNGRLSGSTLEPNTFVPDQGEELDATLRGHVNGTEVVFLKSYHGVDQEPVYYEGEIVDDGSRIVGKWYFGWPDELSGTFELNREMIRSESADVQREASKS